MTDRLRHLLSDDRGQYDLRTYPGRVTLFVLAERDGMSDSLFDPALDNIDPQLGWGRVAAGGVEVHELPGEHISIFREPNVRILAEKLTSLPGGEPEGRSLATGAGGEAAPHGLTVVAAPGSSTLRLAPGAARGVGLTVVSGRQYSHRIHA